MVKHTLHPVATLLNVRWGIVAGLAFCLWTLASGLAVVPMILVVAIRGLSGMLASSIRGLAPEAGTAGPILHRSRMHGSAAAPR